MPPTARTPRSTWIEAGVRALADGGPEAVRIEVLAGGLGVSKGGFYWHFADRDAFLREVLDAWEQASIDDVIAAVEAGGGDAHQRLRRLFALASSGGGLPRADLAVRDWSRRDAAVAARLRRVDDRRMAYLRVLFGGISDDPDDVEVRCLLTFSLWVGSHYVAAGHGDRTRAEIIELALRRLET